MAQEAAPRTTNSFIIAAGAGAAVALMLGVFGKVHDPTGTALPTSLFFTATLNLKAWFATTAFAFALFQLLSGLRLYGKINIPKEMPANLQRTHRITGRIAVLFSLPVAYHCLFALGFQDIETRQLVHSLMGCFFYGAFVAKVIVVRSKNAPSWALPVAAGALFTALTTVWLSSALWFFTTFGFPSI